MIFAFIYWQTAGYEAEQIDLSLLHESAAIARERVSDIASDVSARFAGDLHRQTFAAVLTPNRTVIAGDLASYPSGLPVDGRLHMVDAARSTPGGIAVEKVTAVARALPDGRILVVGRSQRELSRLSIVVGRALALGLVPALILALAVGTWASMRTMTRVAAFREALDRIMDGGLHERLPRARTRDTLDILAASVNRMLDDLERLLEEVSGVGNAIAHDLRTPLSRMRARLEGGRRRSATLAELDDVVTGAIGDLDQCFATVTALLRIGELSSARRRLGFSAVSLTAIVEELGELYQPMAELRDLRFTVRAAAGQIVSGDRDLLFEVGANLVDNAIKFAPVGGTVCLALLADPAGPLLRVSDSGDGIPPAEREAVLQRFYRTDRSRHVEGSGLGLSLVMAILNLHGFRLCMRDMEIGDLEQGFAVEVLCYEGATGTDSSEN